MIVGSNIIHVWSEPFSRGIFSNVYSSFWHISHSRLTSIWHWCILLILKVTDYTARWTFTIGGEIGKISFLLECQLCQSFVRPIPVSWLILQVISMLGNWISQSVIFQMITAILLRSMPGFSWADYLSPRMCEKYWWGIAFCGWNCALPTLESWHNWFKLEMELSWCIPETMMSSNGCQGRGLSGTSHACWGLICPIRNVWNWHSCANGAFHFSTTW